MKLRIADVGRLLGLKLPAPGKKGLCPLQKHKRIDKTFRVFEAKRSGDELYKCWSCPEPNVGDAIDLYARISGYDRREAFRRLREIGFELGTEGYQAPEGPRRREPEHRLTGTRPERIAPLDLKLVEHYRSDPRGQALVREFAGGRGIPVETMLEAGVVGLAARDAVGFVYTDPETGRPCRIKVRGLRNKTFFVVPKGKAETGQKALAPLYLAERLVPGQLAVVTEGECDALALRSVGVPNVVSLPDGSKSAETVDLRPLRKISIWALSFDADEPGAEAARALKLRADRLSAATRPILWQKDGVTFKDANDALKAGLRPEDFRMQLRAALARYGLRLAELA